MVAKRNEGNKTPKDEQRTPDELFIPLNKRFDFTVDIAATFENKKCKAYYVKIPDVLPLGFLDPTIHLKKGDRAWCNPPYSLGNVSAFIEKGYIESVTTGAIVVFLVTADMSTAWWDYCMFAAEWIRIKGRVIFCEEDGTPIKGSPPFASILVVFDFERWLKQGQKTIISELKWKVNDVKST